MINTESCYLVAEIGINHNGDLTKALAMVRAAYEAGCDAVKFQKRTIETVYSPEELARPRQSVFGQTNGELKRGLEFGYIEYREIDSLCRALGLDWYASPWDEASADFLMDFDLPYTKIASASISDKTLLQHCAQQGRPLLISTGMCDLDMIQKAVATVQDSGGEIACLYHCTATYPVADADINLNGMAALARTFPGLPIGYSGHEPDLLPSLCAAALGACSIERHVTLDRTDWGSDQAASLEMAEMADLRWQIDRIRVLAGDGIIRIFDSERPVAEKLRRVTSL